MSGGRLVICPTPIGNPDDLTLRALEELRAADAVACEDTRRTGLLLAHHGIKARLVAVHDHNERAKADAIRGMVEAGERVIFVSDAGMPVVSDPGYLLVGACVAAGLKVEVLPGPSALTSAVAASGLPAGRFFFEGFLPRRRGELARLFETTTETIVAFESPRRVAKSLSVLAETQPGRIVAVCREMTKLHEEVVRGRADELASRYADEPPKGEITLVMAPTPQQEEQPVGGVEEVLALVAAGAKPRVAAKVVASLTGSSANDLYNAVEAARAGRRGAD